MEEIIKKDGTVWLVKYWDVYGKHKTISYLGKEYIEDDDNSKKKNKKSEV